MPGIQFLIKPASSACNLRCKYCFYQSEAENREVASYGVMSEETLEDIVRKGLEYADGMCGFMFQGGEPTLAGLGFFRKLIEFEKKYNRAKLKIDNSIQTNGIQIDKNWARFFHDEHFLVGLSLDGPKEVHNCHRVDAQNNGSFTKAMRAAELLRQYDVEFNILSVVTSNSTRHTDQIYHFFMKNGFRYLQFIPCLDPVGKIPGDCVYSLRPEELEKFLRQLFDRWYDSLIRGQYISIRYFDNLISILLGREPEACSMAGRCACNLVVEADGSVYPCDFYALDPWRLGNIRQMEISDLAENKIAAEFVHSSLNIPKECLHCRWRPLCRGGCRREREHYDGNGPGSNLFCLAYHGFLDYAYERLVKAARILSQRQ